MVAVESTTVENSFVVKLASTSVITFVAASIKHSCTVGVVPSSVATSFHKAVGTL